MRLDVYGPSPSGGEDYAKCIGRDRNAPSCFDLQEARNIFDRMMDSDVWPISVRSGWSDDDLSNATFRFYPAACLSLEGTPVLRPFCKNGNRKRNDSWISVVLPDTSSQAPPPPMEYNYDDLYSMEGIPRNLDADWMDYQRETIICNVAEICIALHPTGGKPIRWVACEAWPTTRLLSPHGLDLWEIPGGAHPLEDGFMGFPLGADNMGKLVSFIVPPDLPESEACSLGVVRGQRLFTPMLITSGAASHAQSRIARL